MPLAEEFLSDRALAFHEAGHAYAGLAAGRSLIEVQISKDGGGICAWRPEANRPVGGDLLSGRGVAEQLFGPLSQIAFAPESVGPFFVEVSASVIQHHTFYMQHPGLRGWVKDLFFARFPMQMGQRMAHRIDAYRQIENGSKKLLSKPDVIAGIAAVAGELELKRALNGESVQQIFAPHLQPLDDLQSFEVFDGIYRAAHQ